MIDEQHLVHVKSCEEVTDRGISLQMNWKLESRITRSPKSEMNKDHRIWRKCDDRWITLSGRIG
jgi:hypothetical protein